MPKIRGSFSSIKKKIQGGEVVQTMYIHVIKCKNNKKKKEEVAKRKKMKIQLGAGSSRL
jgi:hypothetical protein